MLKVLYNANYVTRRDNEFLRSSLLFGHVENAAPGYGDPGCRKHGVWKTRGLMEKHGV